MDLPERGWFLIAIAGEWRHETFATRTAAHAFANEKLFREGRPETPYAILEVVEVVGDPPPPRRPRLVSG